MSTRRVCGIAAGFAALAMVFGSAAAAQGDAFRHRDATGDVRVFPNYNSSVSHLDSRKSDPDIQQFTVLHGRWVLSVATSFRALSPLGNIWEAFIVTSKGDRFTLERRTDPMTSKPYYNLFHSPYASAVKCDGLRVSRTSSGIIGKVPARCLGNPWKVRVGVDTVTGYETGEGSGIDDAMLSGTLQDNGLNMPSARKLATYDAARGPRLSPWIAR